MEEALIIVDHKSREILFCNKEAIFMIRQEAKLTGSLEPPLDMSQKLFAYVDSHLLKMPS